MSDTHSTASNVNTWVSNVTDGHIEKMIDDGMYICIYVKAIKSFYFVSRYFILLHSSFILYLQYIILILRKQYNIIILNSLMSKLNFATFTPINLFEILIIRIKFGSMLNFFFYVLEKSLQDSVMLIMNALFFKGVWRRRYFAPENTRVTKFHIDANSSVNVPYMHTVDRFYYAESPRLDAKILRIPYDVRDIRTIYICSISILRANQNLTRLKLIISNTQTIFFRARNSLCTSYYRIR